MVEFSWKSWFFYCFFISNYFSHIFILFLDHLKLKSTKLIKVLKPSKRRTRILPVRPVRPVWPVRFHSAKIRNRDPGWKWRIKLTSKISSPNQEIVKNIQEHFIKKSKRSKIGLFLFNLFLYSLRSLKPGWKISQNTFKMTQTSKNLKK